MLVALLLAPVAARAIDPGFDLPRARSEGAPLVAIDARVEPGFEVITGTIRVAGAPGVRVVDPLARLPDPTEDRTAQRTWPGAPERGVVRFTERGPGVWDFVTILPRRYDDVGVLPGRSLLANGFWYPQPMLGDRPVIALWTVTVALPDGAIGAVGDAAGAGRLAWLGHGERASLAVLARGRIEALDGDGVRLSVLGRRGAPRAWKRRLVPAVASARPPELPVRAAVVRGPLRRRLARSGRGLAYVSDRAWRVTPGLRRYHDPAVARAVLAASLASPDPFTRDLAAAALVRRRADAGGDARGLLRWLSWNPVVDAILHDRTLPFWADVLDAAHPDDPLRDDLFEVFQPHGPGTARARQIEALYGPTALYALGSSLARGLDLGAAAAEAEVDAALVAAWAAPYPDQDLRLVVDRRRSRIGVLRDAPPGAPPEVVQLRVDGETLALRTTSGSDLLTIEPSAAPRRVVVDPGGLVSQRSRRGDAWPPRFTVTTAAWVERVNLTEGWLSGYASAWARGRDDTRNVWSAGASFDQQTLPSLSIGWLHRRGPLQDGLNRPHRATVWFEPAWTNPRFAPGDRPLLTVGGGAQYAWDTRVSGLFPLRGRRLSATVTAGALPSEGTHWATARLGASGVISPHPRWAFAGASSAAVASGDTIQRLLWLGGPGSISSLPPAAAIGRARGVAVGEARWAPIRHASVPLLGLAWLSEVQLTAGAETGWMRTIDGYDAAVVGVTGGASFVADLLGASPSLVGVTIGRPVWRAGLDGAPRHQVVVRFGQGF
jgi:hypothetical protein